MIRPFSLTGVALGASGLAASVAALYLGMRELMVEHGGSCVSGGPYQVAPGHTCDGPEIWLLTGAPFVGLAFAGLLIAASDAWSDDRIGGLGALLWGGLFGALGWNFLDLGLNPPAVLSGAGELTGLQGSAVWLGCGALFWAMALGGFWYAQYGLRDYFGSRTDEPAPGAAPPPLVRATVSTPRAPIPGMPGAPLASTELWPGESPDTVRTPGSPWIWLATVLASAAAGAGAVLTLL